MRQHWAAAISELDQSMWKTHVLDAHLDKIPPLQTAQTFPGAIHWTALHAISLDAVQHSTQAPTRAQSKPDGHCQQIVITNKPVPMSSRGRRTQDKVLGVRHALMQCVRTLSARKHTLAHPRRSQLLRELIADEAGLGAERARCMSCKARLAGSGPQADSPPVSMHTHPDPGPDDTPTSAQQQHGHSISWVGTTTGSSADSRMNAADRCEGAMVWGVPTRCFLQLQEPHLPARGQTRHRLWTTVCRWVTGVIVHVIGQLALNLPVWMEDL